MTALEPLYRHAELAFIIGQRFVRKLQVWHSRDMKGNHSLEELTKV